ncbi:hypothetical protein JCM3775_004538 [Rhodotorula graminis]
MAAPPPPLKRRFALERTDSTGSLLAHAADLSLNSNRPTPTASPGPESGTATPFEASSSTAGPSQQDQLGRGKRPKTRHSHTPAFVLALPVPSAPRANASQQSKVKGKSKDKGKAKAKVPHEAHGGEKVGDEWWFTDPDELERRRNALILANATTFLNVLPSTSPNYVSKLLESTSTAVPHKVVRPYRSIPPPSSVAGGQPVLKDYQLKGLSWLAYVAENGGSCILADEMGLGKTLQTLALIAYLAEQHGRKGPHLIVCPLSVLGSWASEIERWLPDFTAMRFHGEAGERQRLKSMYPELQPDLVVTTYEQFVSEAHWFKTQGLYGLVVLDEGHRIKNHESQAAHALRSIRSRMRLILTGTPLQNSLVELWSLLHWLYPAVFTDKTLGLFRDAFNLSAGLYDSTFLEKSQKLLGDVVMLRRTKEGVSSELSVPPREEFTLYLPLSPIQRFWYQRLLTRSDLGTLSELFGDSAAFDEAALDLAKQEVAAATSTQGRNNALARVTNLEKSIARRKSGASVVDGDKQALAQMRKVVEEEKKKGGDAGAYKKLMMLMMQLRKCCSHPYLLPDSEPEGELTVDEHVVAASSKLVALDKILGDVLPKGERVLIFSGFTRMLDILEDYMDLRSYKYARLDGQTSRPRRALDIRLFQRESSALQVFLISTRAGGLGVNLTAASTVVMFESDFNPQVDLQAIARAHRIGQTKTVHVYRLVTAGSVEEQAMSRLRKKLYLSLKIMGGMRNATERFDDEEDMVDATNKNEDDAPRLTRGELISMLRAGAGAAADESHDKNGNDAFTAFRKASFADLCQRGRERDMAKDLGVKAELGEAISVEERERLAREEEEEERRLLAGRELISSRKWEGKTYTATNTDIRQELEALVKRQSKARVVMIDGHAVAKYSVSTKAWEAVPTITSSAKATAKLANTKRTTRKFEHEDYCHACKDGGNLYLCSGCPRVWHADCVGSTTKALASLPMFHCPQHKCSGCGRSTAAAGGLLFRCQTCPKAHCEDCLDDGFDEVGEALPELLLRGFGPQRQIYWVRCSECVAYFREHPKEEAARQAAEAVVAKKVARAAARGGRR